MAVEIETMVLSFPRVLDLETATNMLNETIKKYQLDGVSIISVSHEGNNDFLIEYRRVIDNV